LVKGNDEKLLLQGGKTLEFENLTEYPTYIKVALRGN